MQAATTLVDTAVIGRTVRAEQIAETPLSGRRATQVAQLAPGIVGGNMGGSVPTGVGTFATGITSINGGRSDEFMTTIDGAPSIRVRADGRLHDGRAELRHRRRSAGPDDELPGRVRPGVGWAAAAGHQERHAELPRQRVLEPPERRARRQHLDEEPGGLEKSPHNYNAYGFTLGGPIYIPGTFNTSKQKLFFFWGQEWQRDRTVEEQTAIVPTRRDAERRLQRAAHPDRTDPRIPLTGQPFPGNIIPQDRISPQGRALLNAYPLPIPGFQQGANNWIGNPSVFNNQRKDSIKIDCVPTSDHRLAVRHTWAPNVWNDPEPMAVYSTIWDYPGRTLAATLTEHAVATRSSTSSRSRGARRSPSKFFGQRNCDYCPGGTDALPYPTHAVDVGINYPYLFPGTKLDPGQDFERLASGLHARSTTPRIPGSWNDFVFLWADNVTKITGNHAFKAGVSVERSGMNDHIQLSFAHGAGDDEPERLVPLLRRDAPDGTRLLGCPTRCSACSTTTRSSATSRTPTGWRWATTSTRRTAGSRRATLTLELGLRYSLWQPWGDENNAMASFQSAVLQPGDRAGHDRSGRRLRRPSGDPFNGIVLPGDAPTDEALADFPAARESAAAVSRRAERLRRDPKDGFQPRLGMAYAHQRHDDVQSRRRPIPEPRADQHDAPPTGSTRRCRRCRRSSTATWTRRAAPRRATSRWSWRMHSPDFTNATSWAWNATSIASCRGRCAARCRMSAARRRISSGRATSTSCSRARFRRTPASTPTRCGRIWASAASRCTRRPARRNTTACRRRSSAASTRGVGFSVAYTFSRTTDDGSGRGDILPNAYDDSGYYGISDLDRPHVLVSQARYRFPTLDVVGGAAALGARQLGRLRASSRRSPARRSTCAPRRDVAGVGPGQRQPVLRTASAIPTAARTDWDPTRCRAPSWFDETRSGIPTAGTYRDDAGEELAAAARLLGHQHVAAQGLQRGRHAALRPSARSVQHPEPHASRQRRDQSDLRDFGYITSKVGNRTMQIGMQDAF